MCRSSCYNGIAYVSGQVPWVDGVIKPIGKVDGTCRSRTRRKRRSSAPCRRLSWLNQTLPGGLEEVERAIKLTGFVASSADFDQQPPIIDAASEILIKIFGQAGQHARSAIGVAELPGNAAVEVEFIFALKRRGGSVAAAKAPGHQSDRKTIKADRRGVRSSVGNAWRAAQATDDYRFL